MHICMILGYTYPPDVRVKKEAQSLIAAGHEVTLLCRGNPEEPRREHVHGMNVVRLKEDGLVKKLSQRASAMVNLATNLHPLWVKAATKVADDVDADAIHVHDLPLVRSGLFAGRSNDIPVVADLHENYPAALRQWRAPDDARSLLSNPSKLLVKACYPVSRYKRIERRRTRAVDHVFTPVREAARHYQQDCAVPPSDTTVISNTVDLDMFTGDAEPRAGYEDEFVIGYVGTFGPHRGLETAVRAMAQICESVPEARLLLVGSGSDTYEENLREVVSRSGVTENVTFTGWVDFDTFPSYMATCDVCLVPHAETTHTETTVPHKLFQYMAMGRPVVVTDLDPLARVVRDADAGTVVDPENPSGLAAAITTLAADPERLRALGENARTAVEETYNWTRDGDRLVETYDSLVGRSSSS